MIAYDPGKWLERAVDIVRSAGPLLAENAGRAGIGFKGEVDLVTEIDRRSEAMIVAGLREAFPGTRILAEEGTGDGPDLGSGLWILDPLDGTTNFAHGFPVFAISLALERRCVLELGVVHDPTRGETFTALRGEGARLNGKTIGVSRADRLKDSLLATGFPYDVRTSPRNNLKQFSAFALKARGLRRAGAAALDLAYVASGRLDGYWEEKIAVWDVAAGILLVQEAGGRVTGYRGEAADVRSGAIVATNGVIHEEVLSVLSGLEGPGPRPA